MKIRISWAAAVSAVVGLTLWLGASAAQALHYGGGVAGDSTGTGIGFQLHDALIGAGVAVGAVLILGWVVLEGRRHHWHVGHRPTRPTHA